MSLTREEVERVALLARLELSPDEIERMTSQLSKILDHVEQLGQLDTTDVQPMAHAIEMSNVFAEDQLRAGLSRDDALSNAPKRDEECYRVPAVLGE